MKTEEVAIPLRGPRHGAPPALDDLAPHAALILDSRGRPVSVCSAGFVLRAGQKYRLRLVPPAEKDLVTTRFLNPPEFVRTGDEIHAHDERGRRVRDLPFRVRLELGAAVYRLGNVRCDDLEVLLRFSPESGRPPLQFVYPIVVRPGLGFVFLAVLAALLGVAAPLLLSDLWTGGHVHDREFWVKAGAIGVVSLVGLVLFACAAILVQVRHRCGELREAFAERYPPLDSGR